MSFFFTFHAFSTGEIHHRAHKTTDGYARRLTKHVDKETSVGICLKDEHVPRL